EVVNELAKKHIKDLIDIELVRRALMVALGFEKSHVRPEIKARATDWILLDKNPVPYFDFGEWKQHPSFSVGNFRQTEEIRWHLKNYLKGVKAGLTTSGQSRDTEEVNRRQEQGPDEDESQEPIRDTSLPIYRRVGESRFHAPYDRLPLAELRARMKE